MDEYGKVGVGQGTHIYTYSERGPKKFDNLSP